MASHAAFLRGINLGRRRRVSGVELRSLFEQLGFAEVATFRTSGNVVFDAGREPLAAMGTRVEEGVERSLGYRVAIFLRTARQIRALAEQRPFQGAALEASEGKLQVMLLSAKPSQATRRAVMAMASGNDRLAFGERELYWLPRAGTRDSRLDVAAIERLLGPTTMRTKGTIDLLAAKYFG